jgi:hypothetical protein
MRPGMLLQVARVRSELDHWLRHWQTEIKAETVPRHLSCAETLCSELLSRMVRVQGYETQETRAYEAKIEMLARASADMWEPAIPKRSERPRLSLVPR